MQHLSGFLKSFGFFGFFELNGDSRSSNFSAGSLEFTLVVASHLALEKFWICIIVNFEGWVQFCIALLGLVAFSVSFGLRNRYSCSNKNGFLSGYNAFNAVICRSCVQRFSMALYLIGCISCSMLHATFRRCYGTTSWLWHQSMEHCKESQGFVWDCAVESVGEDRQAWGI